MVDKSDFTTEEWQKILTGPQIASMVVIIASPSGPMGVVKEMFAASKLIAEVIKSPSGNALIDAVAADLKEMIDKKEKLEPPVMSKDPNEMKAQCLQACRDLAALLAQKAPAEAEGFKQWVFTTAQHTSLAAKEGGFMGMGGEQVSQAEAAALKEVAEALGTSA